jgi:pyruvate,water dikinase
MTLTHIWNPLLLLLICPLIGGLPLIGWITYALTQQRLSQVGTGNVSVSAAFYHGGKLAGILSVLSEALKGIAAVLLARVLFPNQPAWELIALIALVIGRYAVGKGAGATNVVWGIVAHDWMVAVWVALLGGINFAIFRNRYWGRLAVLILLPIAIGLRHPQETGRIVAAVILSALQALIYERMPEDLELAKEEAKPESRGAFRFFRGNDSLTSLDEELDAHQVGQKAATLSQLKRWGYPVPQGWVLPIAEDAQSLIEALQPSEEEPLVARSSAVEEDVEEASAAGQYETVANITSREELQEAVRHCLESHNKPAAVQYREEHNLPEEGMAVLIQKQVGAKFSGVAFSRDPVRQHGDAVVVEGLPKGAGSVVSGEVTPQQYRVEISDAKKRESEGDSPKFPVEGSGDLPPELVREIAVMAREVENRYNGIPQDIEWSYDGEQLWLLQSRPITNLQPIWTRKIAAEVLPGVIHPLTWSINCPLTCGVWGEIFRVVLGDRTRGLNFQETATLHFSRAYFNATLLGEIFQRMGLPPESLAFLLKGEEFSKPSLGATLSNLPGLLRLLGREWRLERDFERDDRERFAPILDRLAARSESELSQEELLERVEAILQGLEGATYYNILVPLSLSLRQNLLGVEETKLDRGHLPEIAAMRSLSQLAAESRQTLPMQEMRADRPSDIFAKIQEIPQGKPIVEQLEQWLEQYGYLSEAETELAAPRWQENPQPLQDLFAQFLTRDEEADTPQEHSNQAVGR